MARTFANAGLWHMSVGKRHSLALLAISIAVGASLVPGSAFAQASAQSSATRAGKKSEEQAASQTMDQETGKVLREAIELTNKDDFVGAQAKLGTLKMDKLSPYEKSKVYQIQAQIAASTGKYDEARKYLKSAVDSGGLNDQEKSDAQFRSAQYYMAEEKWKEGAAELEEWLKTAQNPNPNAYYLLAAAYYQLQKFDKALPNAKKAVDMSEKPQENWITLLASLYIQNEQFKEAIPILTKLVEQAPDKKTYWAQLSSAYAQMDDQNSAVAVLQLAQYFGLVNEDAEIRRLSQLHAFVGNPYRGAVVMTEGLEKGVVKADAKAYEILANAWINAQEYAKAIGPLQKAAETSSNGDLFVRLGEVQMQREDWMAAEQALRRGIDKGQLKDTNKAELLLGISLYNENKAADARAWLQRASASERHRPTARNYLQAIDAKK